MGIDFMGQAGHGYQAPSGEQAYAYAPAAGIWSEAT